MKLEIITTKDGSHTLYVPELKEHYHSTFGAIQESQHIFVKNGLQLFNQHRCLNILEVGFGTGLNALLTYIDNKDEMRKISYYAVEPFSIPSDILKRLNYSEFLENENSSRVFKKLSVLSPGEETSLGNKVNITMLRSRVQDVSLDHHFFDLVYFDAFGPDVHPDMWEKEVFQKLFNSMKTGGVLLTFSVKGIVKRNLKAAGFSLELLPGPPGKRHILRARK